MAQDTEVAKALEADIRLTQERFVAAMERRLAEMGDESKERYFAVLSTLVARLETFEKPMREVLQETMAEAAALIFAELGAQGK